MKPTGSNRGCDTCGLATLRTYSLAEVAAMVLPPEWTDGERWLSRRLNRGEIRGYRVGRVWRMSEAHVREFIDARSNTVSVIVEPASSSEPARPMSVVDGLSPRSRARLKSSDRK